MKLVKNLISWFARILHLYTEDDVQCIRDALNQDIKDVKRAAAATESSLWTTIETLNAKISNDEKLHAYEIERLKREVERYKNTPSTNAEFYKDVQKQLNRLFHSQPAYEFSAKTPIPGSLSIRTYNPDKTGTEDGDDVIVRGRINVPDDITAQINATSNLYDQLQHILRFMSMYGMNDGLVKSLVMNSGMAFSLTYNEDTTTYELYYELVAKNQSDNTLLTIDI